MTYEGDIEAGQVWLCPIDFIDHRRPILKLDARTDADVLTKDYRKRNQSSEYKVNRLGKYRPVVVLGVESVNDRYLVVPLYSKHESAKVLEVLEQQVRQAQRADRRVVTAVAIDPPTDVEPITNDARETILQKASVARVDELCAVSRGFFDESRGQIVGQTLEELVAAYLWIAWESGIPAVFKTKFTGI